MPGKTSLKDIRKEIADVTLEIFCLCGKRLKLSKKIAEIKVRGGIPIENLKVEEELKKRVLSVCEKYDIEKSFCMELLELLLKESKRVQIGSQKT